MAKKELIKEKYTIHEMYITFKDGRFCKYNMSGVVTDNLEGLRKKFKAHRFGGQAEIIEFKYTLTTKTEKTEIDERERKSN